MSSTFFGINVAYSGLTAQRRAMDILGYNMAHANDPTYKRQRLVMTEGAVLAQSQESSPTGSSAIGMGVKAGDVERVRNVILENRLNSAMQDSAEWSFKNTTMTQLESVLGEPSDTGLQADLDKFWKSWNSLASKPDDISLRTTVLENATALSQRIQYTYQQMNDVRTDLNYTLSDKVDQINQIAGQIGELNNDIGALESGQVPVNDLLNKRDALVSQLGKLTSISQFGESGSDFIISVGGRTLVQGNMVNKLDAVPGAGGIYNVKWSSDGDDAVLQGGEMKAVLELRDSTIPDYLSQLDNFASSLVESVNTIHHTGKTLDGTDGGDFFKAGITAANICLDDNIAKQPRLIAASADGNVGDATIAVQINNLKDQKLPSGLSINDMYRKLVGDIASSADSADSQAAARDLSVQQYTTQQQSISGVSLDEEMSNMIKFQQAYNASARMLTAWDQMLSVLIDKTGLAGR